MKSQIQNPTYPTATTIPSGSDITHSINQSIIAIIMLLLTSKNQKENTETSREERLREKEKSPLNKEKIITQFSELSFFSTISYKQENPFNRGRTFILQLLKRFELFTVGYHFGNIGSIAYI